MKAHGTVFVAGENGPEIMGHVNGRTEILNKAQLAQALYGAVVAGMGKAVNALGSYIGSHMVACTNSINSNIGQIDARLASLQAMRYSVPAFAYGSVMPYEAAAKANSTHIVETITASNEELAQVFISALAAQTASLVSAIQAAGNSGNGGMFSGNSAQHIIDEINRRTQMFSASPLKGV